MAPYKKSPQRSKHGPLRTTASPNVGTHSLIYNEDEAIQLLRAAVEREGNQGAFASRHGIARTYLNQILNRKRSLNKTLLKALRLRKVYAPD